MIGSDLKSVDVVAEVEFELLSDGKPMLMVNPDATVIINGHESRLVKVKDEFNKGGRLYFIDENLLSQKTYKAQFQYTFKSFSHPSLADSERHSHFLPVRYYMHSFTETGIPTNLQFDHYPLQLSMKFKEGTKDIEVFTNGKLNNSTGSLPHHYSFPSHFTGASIYIDIVESRRISQQTLVLKSIDQKREIPLTVYAEKDDSAYPTLSAFAKVIELSFHSLEAKFGPFPHDKIIFKPNNRLNKYSGGAFAAAMSLPDHYLEHMTHELGHSYFGHYFSPSNGNDQWIYEGMGNWLPLLRQVSHLRDKNYEGFYNLQYGSYDIWKTFDAHGIGTALLQSIDAEIRANSPMESYQKGGLVAVFKDLFKSNPPQTVDTQALEGLLSQQTGVDLKKLFSFYFINFN